MRSLPLTKALTAVPCTTCSTVPIQLTSSPSLVDAGRSGRLRGIRANASRRSHTELDESTELDAGDPIEFGQLMGGLREQVTSVTILGGCCGSDMRHIREIAASCH